MMCFLMFYATGPRNRRFQGPRKQHSHDPMTSWRHDAPGHFCLATVPSSSSSPSSASTAPSSACDQWGCCIQFRSVTDQWMFQDGLWYKIWKIISIHLWKAITYIHLSFFKIVWETPGDCSVHCKGDTWPRKGVCHRLKNPIITQVVGGFNASWRLQHCGWTKVECSLGLLPTIRCPNGWRNQPVVSLPNRGVQKFPESEHLKQRWPTSSLHWLIFSADFLLVDSVDSLTDKINNIIFNNHVCIP